MRRWFHKTKAECKHKNGWSLVLDDGHHHKLVRECVDKCGATHTIRQANRHRYHGVTLRSGEMGLHKLQKDVTT